jgi:MFS family permease
VATKRTERILEQPGFGRFWAASTVSEFGTYVTTLALQVLIVVTLDGSATDVGLLNSARWLPYLVFGLLAGVLADRLRRRPVLVATDLGRAVLLGLIPLLAWLEHLSIPVLMVFMIAFGLLSLMNDAAHQSFLPQLVPKRLLGPANARLQQSATAAQASGPVVAGGLISWLGAPVAVLVDAVSYLVSGVLTATIRAADPKPVPDQGNPPSVVREARAGLAWVYGHRMLRSLALTTHSWFLFSSMLGTIYVPFLLLRLGLSPFAVGVTFGLAGLGGLLGSSLSTRIAGRLGISATIAGSRLHEAVGFALIASAPASTDASSEWPTWAMVGAGQILFGFGLGTEGPVEMSYRQSITPDRLQGRMNSTMRSLNRAAIVVGAPAGGLLADLLGYRPALWIGITGLALGVVALGLSPFRYATHDDQAPRP